VIGGSLRMGLTELVDTAVSIREFFESGRGFTPIDKPAPESVSRVHKPGLPTCREIDAAEAGLLLFAGL
jgi:hypothetical protein